MLVSFTSAHKFYVSVTEIEYNEENRALQIISRVFTDDMENLLRTRYNKDLYLTKKEEHPAADDYIAKYLNGKLEVQVNGERKVLNYLGKEYDNDQLIFYVEVEEVEPFEKISVRNEILTDLFPDQKNVVHVSRNGKTKSLLLSGYEEQGLLNFGN